MTKAKYNDTRNIELEWVQVENSDPRDGAFEVCDFEVFDPFWERILMSVSINNSHGQGYWMIITTPDGYQSHFQTIDEQVLYGIIRSFRGISKV